MLPDAEDDAVPENGIPLWDAYQQWCDISNPDWRQIVASYEDAYRALDTDGLSSAELDQKRQERRSTQKIAGQELARAERAAAYSMREALANGSLVALIRDPKTGDILKPSVWSDDGLQNYWRGRTNTDSSAPLESDFVSPDDPNAPGPWAQSDGRRRRVFFWLNDFQHWSGGLREFSSTGLQQNLRVDPADDLFDDVLERDQPIGTAIFVDDECETDGVGGRSELTEAMKPRLTKKQKAEIFREWRASNGEYVPTLSEDIKYMKDRGISRADVRRLRPDFPRRPRGRGSQIGRKS
jgi:hypothetical protein